MYNGFEYGIGFSQLVWCLAWSKHALGSQACVRAGEESKFYLMEIVVIKEKGAQVQVKLRSMKLRGKRRLLFAVGL
jgi:hypothetical protein